MNTARARIEAAAAANGFQPCTITWDYIEYRRSSRYVAVCYDVTGRVLSASTPARAITGTGKEARVQEYLCS